MTSNNPVCSFCGKMALEVKAMVGATSSDAIICDECVVLSAKTMAPTLDRAKVLEAAIFLATISADPERAAMFKMFWSGE